MLLKNKNLVWLYEKAGIVFLAMSVFILYLTFEPAVREEIKYRFSAEHKNTPVLMHGEVLSQEQKQDQSDDQKGQNEAIYPIDEDFGIVIPKIAANAKVIPDVDWQDSAVYQKALTLGVAHAKGTAHPGGAGNVFIFAHSGVDFYEAARYNAVFYLINKLEPGDEIVVLYKKQKFTYTVTEKKIVAADQGQYMAGDSTKKELTLMTCWPAGTTLRRLVVIAKQD